MALSESTQHQAGAPRTLSDDIYLLAGLLGNVLRGSGGERAFAQTESARGLAKELRGGDPRAGDQLDDLARELPDSEAETLVRAFTNYFQLINLAEDSERIRRIRHREVTTGGPRRGSIDEAIGLLAARGVDAEHLAALLDSAQIRLVLTAHPTEARRRTIIAKLARIFDVLLFFFQAEDGIRDLTVTGVQTCALPICPRPRARPRRGPGGRREDLRGPRTAAGARSEERRVGKECRSRRFTYQ